MGRLGGWSWGRANGLVFVSLFAAYAALALSAYELFGALSIGVTFFPPAGLTLASFLLLPRRVWPAVATAIVVGELAVDMGQGQGFWWSLGWAAANLTEPFVGAGVVLLLGAPLGLTRRFAFTFAVGGLVAGPACGAAIGATVLAVANDFAWISAAPDVWVGDALGVLVVAPLVLVVARPAAFASTEPRPGESLVMGLAVAAVAVAFFVADSVPIGYAAIPLLALPAARGSSRDLALASVVVAGALTAATARGHAPLLAGYDLETHARLVQQQVFLLTAVGAAWLLKLEVAERQRADLAARQAERERDQALARAREQQHLGAMYDALSALAASRTTADVGRAVEAHGSRLFDSRARVEVAADPERDDRPRRTGPTPLRVEIGPRNDATLALVQGGRFLGTLVLERSPAVPWSDRAQVRAIAFASLVADALGRVRQSELDHRVALTLQEALMPGPVTAAPGIRAAGRYLPAAQTLEIGGDWFEVIAEPDGNLIVVVGDVVGHNLGAAAAMGQLAAAARALACSGQAPAQVVSSLDLVAERTRDAVMTSITCATLRTDDGWLRYTCAGHPPPCLRHPDGKAIFLEGGRRAPLAVPVPETADDEIVVEPSSALLFYTDGLVERRDSTLDRRLDQLLEVMEEIDLRDEAAACDHIVDAMIDERHEDDVALVLLVVDQLGAARGARANSVL